MDGEVLVLGERAEEIWEPRRLGWKECGLFHTCEMESEGS